MPVIDDKAKAVNAKAAQAQDEPEAEAPDAPVEVAPMTVDQALIVLEERVKDLQLTDPELAAEESALIDQLRRLETQEQAGALEPAAVQNAKALARVELARLVVTQNKRKKKNPKVTFHAKVRAAMKTIQKLMAPTQPGPEELKLRARRIAAGKKNSGHIEAIRAALTPSDEQPSLPMEPEVAQAAEGADPDTEQAADLSSITDEGDSFFYPMVEGEFSDLEAVPFTDEAGTPIEGVFTMLGSDESGLEQIVGFQFLKAQFESPDAVQAWVAANLDVEVPEPGEEVEAEEEQAGAVQNASVEDHIKACFKCSTAIKPGFKCCSGCGANIRDMLKEALANGGEVPVPVQPEAEVTPEPVVTPTLAPPAPELAVQNSTSKGDIRKIDTRMQGAFRLVADQAADLGSVPLEDYKIVTDPKTGDRYAEGTVLVLQEGWRKDKLAFYTGPCVTSSIQNFSQTPTGDVVDIWFKHRPPIGSPGSDGVLSDKAGQVVKSWIQNGVGLINVRIWHKTVVDNLAAAQFAAKNAKPGEVKVKPPYEFSFDGIAQAQPMATQNGEEYDLTHHIPLVRSVDLVDKGAVEDSRFIPQAAGLQEETMPTQDQEKAFDLDAAVAKRLVYIQNACQLADYSKAASEQSVAWASQLKKDELVEMTSDAILAQCKTFAVQNAPETPATIVGTPGGPAGSTENVTTPYDTCKGIADQFFDKKTSFPRDPRYMIRCMQNALGISAPVNKHSVTKMFRGWSTALDGYNRLGHSQLGLVASQNSDMPQHSDEVYISDTEERQRASTTLFHKAVQASMAAPKDGDGAGVVEKAHQAAINAAAIAVATQDVFEIRKIKRFRSVLDGGGMAIPISMLIDTTIPVDDTQTRHEVEGQWPDVFSAVAELANYTEQVAPAAREWTGAATLFGAYQTYSEEARKLDRADILVGLPDEMAEMMAWTEYVAVLSPFMNNSNLSDGAALYNAAAGNISAVLYTFANYVNLLVSGIGRTDYSVGTGIDARHFQWSPVASFGAPALWANVVRDTSASDKPDTTDRAANVVTHGFGAIQNFAQSDYASAAITTVLNVIGAVADGPIGTMLRYEGRDVPQTFIADDRSAPGPGWLANAIQVKVRHGFAYYVKSRLNTMAIIT